jgi:plasmid maintenance system antidote protein VapI
VRIGKLLGDGPETWLRIQMEHDLWRAKREVDISEIKTLEIAA